MMGRGGERWWQWNRQTLARQWKGERSDKALAYVAAGVGWLVCWRLALTIDHHHGWRSVVVVDDLPK